MITFAGTALRERNEFQILIRPENQASSTFMAPISETEILVTRRAQELFHLPDETPVVAHWHGGRRTAAFSLTIGLLKAKAKDKFGSPA